MSNFYTKSGVRLTYVESGKDKKAIVLNQTYQDYRETIKKINVPTFVAFGEDPKLNSPEAGMWIKDNIKDSKIKIFKNSSHCPFWEEPEEFNKAVKDFVDSIK